jgi:hypothetical protein
MNARKQFSGTAFRTAQVPLPALDQSDVGDREAAGRSDDEQNQ